MLAMTPSFPSDRPARLLFLGAHSDDIEIGGGGTVLRYVAAYPDVQIKWVVFGCSPQRAAEAKRSAADFLAGARDPEVVTLDFPDAYFPSRFADIKRALETLKPFEPDLVFTHAGHDLHQDHRLISELTWNTFRRHFILEYEVPKYDADLRSPNFFVHLSSDECKKKVGLLNAHFASQRSKHWFDEEVFRGLMRIRGMECAAPSGYAEGFFARKTVT
jgi:LmbE family N-acetylglucosaminyl deacetylase